MLIGIGIFVPFLTAWILYNILGFSQYPLMQANIVVGTLAAYVITRDPRPAQLSQRRGAGPAATMAVMILAVFLCSALAAPVLADDCTRDPLNAQDCLRTPGFAEFIAGLVAAVLAGLVNGPIILQALLQGAQGSVTGTGAAMTPEQLDAATTKLVWKMQDTIDQAIKDGYFVRNDTLLDKAWNNTLGYVKNEMMGNMHGGQCQEFGEWGMKWAEAPVKEIFGKDTIVDDIVIYQNALINHRAVKIITPDGHRFVLDYWEGVSSGKASILTEDHWISNWQNKLGFDSSAEIHRTTDERALENLIRSQGEEKGIQIFKAVSKQNPGKAQAVVNSYKTNPWFKPNEGADIDPKKLDGAIGPSGRGRQW